MKRLWLVLLLCGVALALPVGHGVSHARGLQAASYAQDSPVLVNLEISIWPEYDRPAVLVIYRGQVEPASGTAAAAFPLSLEIGIPAGVGAPHAVAYVGEDGNRFNMQHTTRVEGDRLIVAFDLPAPDFQLEYYDELPVSGAGARQYVFSYMANYPVRNLLIEVQEPPLAQDLQLDPATDSSSVASDGLRYHTIQAGSLEQGETRRWTLGYTKEDDRLTTAFFQQATPAPVPTPPAAVPEKDSSVGIFVVAFVALVGVGVAAYWLGQRTQAPTSRRAPAPDRASARGTISQNAARPKRDRAAPTARAAYFCHKCGAEIRDDALFCHRCGAAARRE